VANHAVTIDPDEQNTRTELGKYMRLFAQQMRELGWTKFFRLLQHPIDINTATIHTIRHTAAQFLHRLAKSGVPAPSGAAPWSKAKLHQVYNRGPHASALHQFRSFLFEDMLDMVKKRYWIVLPFSAVRHFAHLKLAPAGVVPQRTRRPRPIIDYTFTDVNANSAPLAPTQAMQFGQAIQRILQRIAYTNPKYGPALLSKVDLSDGYYRVPLSPSAALELAVVLPPLQGTKPIIGIPLKLPMGWKYSPPYFCAYTETVADLSNHHIVNQTGNAPHRLESAISQIPAEHHSADPNSIQPPLEYTLKQPIAYTDVYMDDFLGISQNPTATLTQRSMLHSIDTVFRANPLPDDPPARKQVISQSKLAAGDCTWSTTKLILGWLLDTASRTLRLPQHKAHRLATLLSDFMALSRTSRKKWQQLLGELRHMATAIPGARYLFSILQHVLVQQPGPRVRLSHLVKQSLQDWGVLATELATEQTPIQSLVPTPPTFLGTVDASGSGLGGCWIPTPLAPTTSAYIFRQAFPAHIQQELVSVANPSGSITNSDLELAALVFGAALVRHLHPSQHASLLCASDNTATVTWTSKGSTSSTAARALLLRWLATLTRRHTFTLQPVFTPGSTNQIADCCSRSFHLSDQDFLNHINRRFPIHNGWKLAHPPKGLVSHMTLTLSGEMLPWASPDPDRTPPPTLGPSGSASARPSTSIPLASQKPTLCQYFKSLPIATATERFLPASLRSVAAQWGTPFEPLGRRWPTWDWTIHP
jgi:hypothetical protein